MGGTPFFGGREESESPNKPKLCSGVEIARANVGGRPPPRAETAMNSAMWLCTMIVGRLHHSLMRPTLHELGRDRARGSPWDLGSNAQLRDILSTQGLVVGNY